MFQRFLSLAFCLVIYSCLAADSTVSPWLAEPILTPETTLSEVQRFAEARIRPMPKISTKEEWECEAKRVRSGVLHSILFRGEAGNWDTLKTNVEWLETIEGGPGYKIRKLRYEAVPGLWIPALLYVPDNLNGKVPAVMNVNGHDGKGKAAPYKQIRCINQAKRGMLALNLEWFGMGQLNDGSFDHYKMNQMDLCGTPGLAPFYFALKRGLDILASLPNTDTSRIAVTGLSGGAWQTIFISSLDERVALSNPVAGYSSFFTRARFFEDLGDSEQTPSDLATVADYTHLTALRAPRPTLLTYNEKDNCCFATPHALQPLVDAAMPIFALYGKTNALRTHNNFDPGTHNYEKDNRQQHYRMLGDFFFPGDSSYVYPEIESDCEVKSADQLNVELPANNKNFNVLARELSAKLPIPMSAQVNARERLREVAKTPSYQVKSEALKQFSENDTRAVFSRLRLSEDWTIGVVELSRPGNIQTVLLISDEGRSKLAELATTYLNGGTNVLVFDPFFFGESKIKTHDFLFAILVAAVGERPIGIQAGQIDAVGRWWKQNHPGNPLHLHANGPRLGVAARISAALNPQLFSLIQVDGELTSLKQVIDNNWGVNEKPELFCFGLLKEFDLPQIKALAAPR